MDPLIIVLLVVVALAVGLAAGWFVGERRIVEARAERDLREAEFKRAITELAEASSEARQVPELRGALEHIREERDVARLELVQIRSDLRAAQGVIDELKAAKEQLRTQFSEVAAKTLQEAQDQFLKRADARFAEAGNSNEAKIRALLQPVETSLKRYEEQVGRIEAERKTDFGNLAGVIEQMRLGQNEVRAEASKLVNALRSAPKARGRWGEQQLRNVLETCGLAEHTDFEMEVSVESDGNRLRPDAIVRIPGGKSLVIDAKVSLNAYQDAHGAVDDAEKALHMTAHVASMKNHINQLGSKNYQQQFEDAPDYVVMFVPGEHFLSAALDHDPELWDYAFNRRVLIATPTNLIAIARTVDAVWRQEKLAKEARQIAELGRELHGRIVTMGSHVERLGKNLGTAMGAYNSFVGSLESQVMTSAKRFEALNIETAGKTIEPLPVIDHSPRPLTKLIVEPEKAAQIEAGKGEEASEPRSADAEQGAADPVTP
ncbi:DNA recombination protein RmuC [Sphingomonas sp. BGYR3]|uniref:DNA recombination protein RmuC n=1 Tax=Sphingomonas sp. BGYR3 TaxID=2975483 RepID=UPI0021A7E9E8|nr:DNA recombination protein RmuC [Sphingomonas sp. BGYR3]MDG5487366.1 DNA recombination protein RmuC [Sphingomonas sp. BGYR3]